MAFERISLNIIPDGEMPVFHASQFDAGRPIIIDLYNGDDAYTPAVGVTFELHCRKVDDNIVTLDTYEVDDNTITFASTEQLCACSGDNLCEVAIMLDDLLMGTLNFILHVERDPLAGGLTSETSIYNLTQQIDDIISGEGYVKDTDLNILQSDWNETDEESPAYIKNKPGPSTYEQADWTENDPSAQSYIKNKPDLKTVATSGSYNDLTDKPTIPAAQVQSDWNQTNTSAVDFIKNKPDLMVVKSSTGNPCTFYTDLADNLVSLTAEIVASGGGGTPSTPIPIVGYSQAVITANSTPVTIAFGQTVYGGVLDVTRGKLHVTWYGVDEGSIEWTRKTDGAIPYFRHDFTDSALTQLNRNFICSNYPNVPFADIYSSGQDNAAASYVGGIVIISNNDYSDANAFKTAMSGQTIVYELATPFDIDLTPVQISALVGTNNITSDLGGDVEVRYVSGELAGQIIDICKMVIAEQGE